MVKKVAKLKKDKKSDLFDPHYYECACLSPDHRLVFQYDLEANELYTEVFINSHPSIFKRLWLAIKYIFNSSCRYGHFDCFTSKPEDVKKMRNLFNLYIKNMEKADF